MSEKSPIIIIGAARSGTKFLRDVLSSVDGVCCVPYDINYVWRYLAEHEPSDVLDPSALDEKKIEFIRKAIYGLAKKKPGDVLLEKTVSNSLRVPYVDRVFPNARYIHLVRDGKDVAESAMRQWESPPDVKALLIKLRGIPFANFRYVFWFGRNFVKGLFSGRKGGQVWGPRFPGIQQLLEERGLALVCARQWVESVSRADADLKNITDPKSRVYLLNYRQLMTDDSVFEKLIVDLQLPHQEQLINNFNRKRKPVIGSRWKEVSKSRQAVIEKEVGKISLEGLESDR